MRFRGEGFPARFYRVAFVARLEGLTKGGKPQLGAGGFRSAEAPTDNILELDPPASISALSRKLAAKARKPRL